jgi:hypothetical protein
MTKSCKKIVQQVVNKFVRFIFERGLKMEKSEENRKLAESQRSKRVGRKKNK